MDDFERIAILVNFLNEKTKEYDSGNPSITDEEWDNAYFELVDLEKKTGIVMVNSPTQTINYDIVNSLTKVTHNHPMLSLAKTKDWNEFLGYFDSGKDVVGMVKLDGLTCSLCYENGVLVSAETRGDGEVGEDILHNAKVISSIPKRIKYKERLVVDGEVICTYNNFQKFSDEYKNPRNFASGSIRLLDSKECEMRNLTFVVWNVVNGFSEKNSVLDRFNECQKLGFTIVPWTSSFDLEAKEFLTNEAKQYGYPIDGLVGRYNDINYGENLGSTAHHSRAAYAFKFYDETYETQLINIEWTMGRTGQITPIAVFETLDIDGTSISRASLSNISVMEETLGKNPFVGQKVYVSKRNMIIPKIEKAKDENGDWI